jgi:hypothetical protein
MGRVDIDAPIVIRLDGTNADEGRAILEPHLSDKLQMEAHHARRRPTAVVALARKGRGTPRWHLRRREHQGRLPGPHRLQGRYYGLRNRDYGTQVVAGTNPKKAGTDVDGIPIFATSPRPSRPPAPPRRASSSPPRA